MSEYIYILSNPSMSGMIKVGKTTNHPNKRMSELRTTGVPTPFVLELSLCVNDCHASERAAHITLDKYRVTGDREFFKISVKSAMKLILPVIGDYTFDYANSAYDIEEVERWFHEKLWAEYSSRSRERSQVVGQINELKNKLTHLGRRPKRNSLPDSLTWVWFVTAPMPFGWMFWMGIPGIFSEKMMPIGLICSVVSIVGFLLNKQVSEYRDDFNSKNAEFARIDSLIGDLEGKLARLPELQKPSERQPDKTKRIEPWVTSREVVKERARAIDLAKNTGINQQGISDRQVEKSDNEMQGEVKHIDSGYKFQATEDYLKYKIDSTYAENSGAIDKRPTWKTSKYKGKCSSCGTYFEVTLNSDERTALCPKCFHPNSHKTMEPSIDDQPNNDRSNEKFLDNLQSLYEVNQEIISYRDPEKDADELARLHKEQARLARILSGPREETLQRLAADKPRRTKV